MSQTEETQKQLRNKVIAIYQTGKGYRVTSKALALFHTWRKLGTVVNLPSCSLPTKGCIGDSSRRHKRIQKNI